MILADCISSERRKVGLHICGFASILGPKLIQNDKNLNKTCDVERYVVFYKGEIKHHCQAQQIWTVIAGGG